MAYNMWQLKNNQHLPMKTTFEIPKTQEIEKVIFNPEVIINMYKKMEILAIRLGKENLIRIDFLYKAPNSYVNGGWVQMSPECFIRPWRSSTKYPLVKAENIPLAPAKHYFKKQQELLSYSLYFPELPEGTKTIDIIESDSPGLNWFNFYGVSLENAKKSRIKITKN
jgi:hypothetical protein